MPDVDLVAVLALELLGVSVRDLNSFQIVVELDLLVEALLLRVVAAEEVWFCCMSDTVILLSYPLTKQTNTSVFEDRFLVSWLDVLVIDWITRLAVNPTDVQLARLETSIEVLDEA